jgi:cell wall-associated NlpC family hydrolase
MRYWLRVMAEAMSAFDRRVTPARGDIAAKHLQGKVKAARFVEGQAMEVIAPQAPLRREPRPDARLDTEALKGERVTIYDADSEGWAWGQLAGDHYVGWLPSAALAPLGPAPTHRIAALRTLVFPGPSIRLPPIEALPFGATLNIARIDDRLAITPSGGYVPAAHLAPIADYERDFVAVAEQFVGAPYLWGGKTALGLDCSGLLQIALSACGVRCPRDSDMQERALGAPLDHNASTFELRRGDLVFWSGHVAIARDRDRLVHANAFHMSVVIEPAAEAIARIRGLGSEIASVRRMAFTGPIPTGDIDVTRRLM